MDEAAGLNPMLRDKSLRAACWSKDDGSGGGPAFFLRFVRIPLADAAPEVESMSIVRE